MAQRTHITFLGILRTLIVAVFRLTAMTIGFMCRVTGYVLTKISELLFKMAS